MSRISLLLILMLPASLLAQGGGFNYANEVAQRASTPESPEAAAFARYGDVGVNMYSGTPNIAVPIYTHQGRELNLPINLTYDASGVRVHQKPTMVGLGWNLNVGGRISRQVNGLPDDYIASTSTANYTSWYNGTVSSKMATYSDPSYYFGLEGANSAKIYQTQAEAEDYLDFLRKVHEQEYETQPDYYNLSVMGLNDTFVFDRNSKTPFSLDNSSIKISTSQLDSNNGNSFETFVVTSDDGTTYTFEAVEITRARKTTDNNASNFDHGRDVYYNSSWYLIRVSSPLGKDIYEFEYAPYVNNRTDEYGSTISEMATSNIGGPPEDSSTSILYSSREVTISEKKYLSKIKHNEKVIVEMTVSNNVLGGPDAAINNITIYSNGNSSSGIAEAKIFDLNYSYFKADPNTPHTNHLNVRLKLDDILIKDANGIEEYSYEFDYDRENEIPSLTDSGQDYLGFYNGAPNTTGLIRPSIPGNTAYPASFGYQFAGSSAGANRNPNDYFSTIGMLTKIKYPSGGYSEFEFEGDGIAEPIYDNGASEEKSTLTLSATTAAPVQNDECNVIVTDISNSTSYSAKNISDVFFVTSEGVGTHTISLSKSGTSQFNGLFDSYQDYVLVKVPDNSTVYSWNQIYNNNCELLLDDSDLVIASEGYDSDLSKTVYLEAGYYQLMILLYDVGYTKTVSITGPSNILIPIGYNTIPRAGVRVAKITDYASAGIKAKEKTYEYSSSSELTRPQLEYVTQERYRDVSSPSGFEAMRDYQVLHRVPYALNGSKQHIAYPRVIESIVDFTDPSKSLIKTTQFQTPSLSGGTYNSGTYTYPLPGGTYTATNYSKSPTSGSVKGSWTNTQSTTTTFNNTAHYRSTYGVATGAIGRNNNLFPTIQGSLGNYRIVLKQGTLLPFFSADAYFISGTGSFDAIAPPECFGQPNCTPEIARLFLHRTYAHGSYAGDTDTSTTTTDGVVTSTTYQYTEGPNRYVKEMIREGTGGNPQEKTVYTYPFEVFEVTSPDPSEEGCYTTLPDGTVIPLCDNGGNPNGTHVYPALVNANMINQPVRIEQYYGTGIDEKLTSRMFTLYQGKLPQTIFTSKTEDEDYEPRMTFEQYENSNLVQARQEDGTPVSFIWGYDNRYVIAKISNMAYDQLPPSLVAAIKNASDTGNQSDLLSSLENLQSDAALANSMMTYYTYIPNVGVNTMTDERGYQMQYFYDDFQRLERVEDQDGNILSENQYNYRIND